MEDRNKEYELLTMDKENKWCFRLLNCDESYLVGKGREWQDRGEIKTFTVRPYEGQARLEAEGLI